MVGLLRELHLLGEGEGLLYTTLAVVAGITYNFFPFMALPLYVSLEQIDVRLLESAEPLRAPPRLPPRHAPALAPGIVAGTLLTFITMPATSSTPSCSAPHAADDRQRHPGEVPRVARLSAAASLSFVLMAAILVALLVYAAGGGHGEADRMTTAVGFVQRHWLTAYALIVVGYLMLPIAVVILFSFNDPVGRFNVWQSFLRQLGRVGLGARAARLVARLDRDRPARDPRRDRARHADRDRDRPARVPRPRQRTSSSCPCRRPRSSSAPRS